VGGAEVNPLTSIELALRLALVFAESASPEQRQQIVAWWIADIGTARKDFEGFIAWIRQMKGDA
jgi:hypothetical protein